MSEFKSRRRHIFLRPHSDDIKMWGTSCCRPDLNVWFYCWTLISSKSSTSLTALKLNWCWRWTWRWQPVIVGVVWRWRKLLVLLRTARERLRPLWSQFRVLLWLISRFFMFSCSSSWSWSASAAIETGDGLSGRDTAPENFSVWGREKEDKPTLEYNICKQWFNL